MRKYDDPVDVRKGPEAPEQFLWRGRLWQVRDVIAHWVETGAWWQSGTARAVIGSDEPAAVGAVGAVGGGPGSERMPACPSSDLLTERELWRVEAGRGPNTTGVFDLAFDWADGRWQLVGCLD